MRGAIPPLCYTSFGYVSQLNAGRNVPVVSIIIAVLFNIPMWDTNSLSSSSVISTKHSES